MGRLNKVTNLVTDILEEVPSTRDSDEDLYLHLVDHILHQHYAEVFAFGSESVNLKWFFKHRAEYGIPSIETVGRCRRKAQELHPELRSSKFVQEIRSAAEVEFQDFALGGDQCV